jgi:hypothetical protein
MKFYPDSASPTFTQVQSIISMKDGGFMAGGKIETDVNGRNVFLEHLERYDSSGILIWKRSFLNPNGYNDVNRIEPTNRGTFLISGSDGPDIFIHEIDSTGYPLGRRVLYTHPQRYGWYGAKVWQHPGGYILSGREASVNSDRQYFGLHNSSGLRYWGAFGLNAAQNINVNSDGSFWALAAVVDTNDIRNTVIYFTKFRHDSTVLKQTIVSNTNSANYINKRLDPVLYLGDGTAIIGGSIKSAQTSYNEAFYLCKIDSIGLPFDPTPVVRKVVGGVAISVYTNPTSGHVQVAGIAQATEYEVCTMQGKVLDTGVLQPNGSISLAPFVAGVYLIRVGGGVMKVVRE